MSMRDITIPLEVVTDEEGFEVYQGRAEDLRRLKSKDLSNAVFVVAHPDESDQGATLTIKPQRRKPVTPELVLSEVARAEEYFQDTGYVGLGYFLTGWKSKDMSIGVERRQEMLDDLADEGLVQIYQAEDGKEAIRTTKDAHPEG